LGGNSFGAKGLSDYELYTVENVAKRFGVTVGLMDYAFKCLDQSAGELIVQRGGILIATQSGLEKIPALLAAIDIKHQPAPSAEDGGANGSESAQTPAPAGNGSKMPAIASLCVVRRRMGHRMTATLPSGALVAVEVRDTAKFMPGMVLEKCAHVLGHLYRYTGKLPRRKGRW